MCFKTQTTNVVRQIQADTIKFMKQTKPKSRRWHIPPLVMCWNGSYRHRSLNSIRKDIVYRVKYKQDYFSNLNNHRHFAYCVNSTEWSYITSKRSKYNVDLTYSSWAHLIIIQNFQFTFPFVLLLYITFRKCSM